MAGQGLAEVLAMGPGLFGQIKLFIIILALLLIAALALKIYKERSLKKGLLIKIEEYKTVLRKLATIPHIEKEPDHKVLGRKKKNG